MQTIAVLVSFGLPALLGFFWNGWPRALGAFLIAGVARIVVLQHCTFLINSALRLPEMRSEARVESPSRLRLYLIL